MFSLKDKYILGYIFTIWLYLVFRMNHLARTYADYDSLLLSFIIFGGWYIVCSYRSFVLTRKKLSEYYYECGLDYKPLMKNGVVDKIYVKIYGTDDWYELDYTLTIPQYSQPNVFYSFVNKNRSVRELLNTMNAMANDMIIGKEYKLLKTEYASVKWLTFSIILLVYLIVFMAKYSNGAYYY